MYNQISVTGFLKGVLLTQTGIVINHQIILFMMSMGSSKVVEFIFFFDRQVFQYWSIISPEKIDFQTRRTGKPYYFSILTSNIFLMRDSWSFLKFVSNFVCLLFRNLFLQLVIANFIGTIIIVSRNIGFLQCCQR